MRMGGSPACVHVVVSTCMRAYSLCVITVPYYLVIKGQPRDSYDEYAQESLYYRGIAYEAKGDMKNAYRDVIELLPFNPRVCVYTYR